MARAALHEVAEEVNALVGARRELKNQILTGRCSMAELTVLAALDAHGLMRVSELAEQLGVDASVVSRQVAQLVEHGLAERTTDPGDGRSHPVRATPHGGAVLADARDRLHATWDDALAGWSEADLRALATGMARLRADLARFGTTSSAATPDSPRIARRPQEVTAV